MFLTKDHLSIQNRTVRKLRGQNAVGNVPGATQKFSYEELDSEQGSLF